MVHAVVPGHELDNAVATYVHELLASGPEAVAAAKALIPKVAGRATAAGRGRPFSKAAFEAVASSDGDAGSGQSRAFARFDAQNVAQHVIIVLAQTRRPPHQRSGSGHAP